MSDNRRTVKITENSYKGLNDNRNGHPRTKFLDQLFNEIEVVGVDKYTMQITSKKKQNPFFEK